MTSRSVKEEGVVEEVGIRTGRRIQTLGGLLYVYVYFISSV